MRAAAVTLIALAACTLGQTATQSAHRFVVAPQEPRLFEGACDASGAVAIDATRFVVCDDEDNILRVYDLAGGPALLEFDASELLGIEGDQEADLEGAERVGDLVYWISSHGRNRAGKRRSARHRFFATRITSEAGELTIEPVGEAYTTLLDDFFAAPGLASYDLDQAAERAPKDPGGLNVEALCARPDGGLWIGLRNPIPGGKALVVPLDNPGQVIRGEGARLGVPFELDLGGLGLRSMERWVARDLYLLVAGSESASGPFQLFVWSGVPTEAPEPVHDLQLGDLRPECMVIPSNVAGAATAEPTAELLLLSDDGGVTVDGGPCKELPRTQRRFRALVVQVR